jgi:hypothetical protein
MPISLDCPACSRSYQVREEFANRTIHCKSCGEAMIVPPARPAAVKSPAPSVASSRTTADDDWSKAFGGSGKGRSHAASRTGPGRAASGRGRSRETFDEPDEEGDQLPSRRSLRGASRRSPMVWVLVAISILSVVGALGLGVMFGIMRRQSNTAPGPGGFPGGFPGNSSIPGVPPAPSIPRPDFTAPDFTPREFTPPDFAPPAMPPLPTIPPPPFPRREVPRPGTTPPGTSQPSTGPVGPNLKEDPNRPGGFPAAPGGAPR